MRGFVNEENIGIEDQSWDILNGKVKMLLVGIFLLIFVDVSLECYEEILSDY